MIYKQLEKISPIVTLVKKRTHYSMSHEWINPEFVLIYMLEGSCDILINKQVYSVSKGCMMIIPPFVPHIVRGYAQMLRYIIHFTLGEPFTNDNAASAETALSSVYPIIRVLSHVQLDIEKRLERMFTEYTEKKPGYFLALKALTIDTLLFFLRSQDTMQIKSESENFKGWAYLQRAISYIYNNYSDPSLSNVTISEYTGVTPTYLSKLFKEELDMTIHHFLTNFRMEKAKHLLTESTDSVTDISTKIGFTDIHSFSKLFKSKVGVSPMQFRHSPKI